MKTEVKILIDYVEGRLDIKVFKQIFDTNSRLRKLLKKKIAPNYSAYKKYDYNLYNYILKNYEFRKCNWDTVETRYTLFLEIKRWLDWFHISYNDGCTKYSDDYIYLLDTTQIPVSLWFLAKNKKQKGKTLFIDARKMGTMVTRKLRELTDEDIQKLAETYKAFTEGSLENVKGFCAAVETAEIAKQDYILTPGRYVGIEEQQDDGEPFEEKMTRLTLELSEMFKKSHDLEEEIRKNLGAIGYEV